jgi:hypothetical protein
MLKRIGAFNADFYEIDEKPGPGRVSKPPIMHVARRL